MISGLSYMRKDGLVVREVALEVTEGGEIIGEPCGCFACNERVQPGHFLCSVPAEHMLVFEEHDRVERRFDGGRWAWFI